MKSYREILRYYNYPENVLEKMTDEECEEEYEILCDCREYTAVSN